MNVNGIFSLHKYDNCVFFSTHGLLLKFTCNNKKVSHLLTMIFSHIVAYIEILQLYMSEQMVDRKRFFAFLLNEIHSKCAKTYSLILVDLLSQKTSCCFQKFLILALGPLRIFLQYNV